MAADAVTRKKMLTSTKTKNSLKIWEFSPVSEHRVASTLFYVIFDSLYSFNFPFSSRGGL